MDKSRKQVNGRRRKSIPKKLFLVVVSSVSPQESEDPEDM
jgi:hypothetical protein